MVSLAGTLLLDTLYTSGTRRTLGADAPFVSSFFANEGCNARMGYKGLLTLTALQKAAQDGQAFASQSDR